MIKELSAVIERLEKAIEVCYEAEQTSGHEGYAYATGYSRVVMMDTLKEITEIIHTQEK